MRLRPLLACLWALLAIGVSAPMATARAPLPTARIGVFYFPGWAEKGAPDQGWDKIKPYPEREPLLGWYHQDDPAIMGHQLKLMAENAVSFVAFDWYYDTKTSPHDSAINTYLRVPQSSVNFAVFWANHDKPTSPDDWRTIVDMWLTKYMRDRRYLTVDGRPVVYIMLFEKLQAEATAAGSSAAAYLKQANAMARAAGLPGLYIIGANEDDFTNPNYVRAAMLDGVNAVSAYNLHRKPQSVQATDPAWGRPFHGYAELMTDYQSHWTAARALPLPVVLPLSAGWDARPWGGFSDPLHDRSIGTPAQLRAHLAAARRELERPGPSHSGIATICCWNEFGEGSFIEPTRSEGSVRLAQVRAVFGRGRRP